MSRATTSDFSIFCHFAINTVDCVSFFLSGYKQHAIISHRFVHRNREGLAEPSAVPTVLTRVTWWYSSDHWSTLEDRRDQGKSLEWVFSKGFAQSHIVSRILSHHSCGHSPRLCCPAGRWYRHIHIPSCRCKFLKGKNRALTITMRWCPEVLLAQSEHRSTVRPVKLRWRLGNSGQP